MVGNRVGELKSDQVKELERRANAFSRFVWMTGSTQIPEVDPEPSSQVTAAEDSG